MKKTFLLSLCLSFLFSASYGQKNSLSFYKTYHDFGRMRSGNDPLTYAFIFKNTSEQAVSIQNVESDCGCIALSYKSTPVQPNETDTVTLRFYPYRAGMFEKSFTVLNTGSPNRIVLKIAGFIMPYSKNDLENEFLYPIGRLRFKHKSLNFGTIKKDKVISKRFKFYNFTDSSLVFTDKMVLPKHIKVYFDSTHIIEAGKTGSIVVEYDPQMRTGQGYLQDHLVLFTNDPTYKRLNFRVVAYILASDSAQVNLSNEMLTEDETTVKIEKPKLRLSEENQFLGYFETETSIVTEIVLYNEGERPLRIHNLGTDEVCEILTPFSGEIAPEESLTLKIKFNPSPSLGKQIRQIHVFTNDPQQNKKTIQLSAEIVAEEQ